MTDHHDRLAENHLDRALDADDARDKDYYIRQALQALVLDES